MITSMQVKLALQCKAVAASSLSSAAKHPLHPSSSQSLLCILQCNPESPFTINFYSFADRKYQQFLPLYAFYALTYNPGSIVEMVVENPIEFVASLQQQLSYLSYMFTNQIFVRVPLDTTRHRSPVINTRQYVEPPIVRNTNFTYLGDVNVFMNKAVLDPMRLEQMKHYNLRYSNIVRYNTTQLTGVMLL